MSTGTETPYDCFISYASADLSFAEEVFRHLDGAGFKVWFDKARLRPGFEFHREIEAGCDHSRILLPVLTPRWQESEWTKYETYGSEATIPLLVEGGWNVVAPPPLKRFHFCAIDLSRPATGDWDRLITAIRDHLRQPRPDKQATLVRVRHGSNPFFVGREKELNLIHERLFESQNTGLTPGKVEVISAMGGVGKTSLARQYIDKFWRCYRQVFWVDCHADLATEFADIGASLFPALQSANRSPGWIREAAERARVELEQVRDRPLRLLVLDGAENEDAVLAWVPKAGNCHTLITSRFAAWSAGFDRAPVWLLEPEPACDFLLRRADRAPERISVAEAAACRELAERLGYLPLALEQAAAFISRQGAGFSFADYSRLYDRFERELLAGSARGATEYPESILVSWGIAIDTLADGARAILRLASFMGATPLPVRVFVQAAGIVAERARTFAKPGPGAGEAPAVPSEVQIRNWKDALAAYSLVRTGSFDDFSVHSLVQAVERHRVQAAERPAWCEQAMQAWVESLPRSAERFENWPLWRPALPHAEALWKHAATNPAIRPPPALLTELAAFLLALGRSEDALGPARRDVQLRQEGSDPDHRDTLTSKELLGQILRQTGGLAEAETVLRTVLRTRRNLFGLKDRHTLASMNTLAGLLTERGAVGKARVLYEKALAIGAEVMPSDHRDLLYGRHNLAHSLDVLGEHEKAEVLYRQAQAGFERTVGGDHPDTLICLHNLANAVHSLGRHAEAETHYWRALAGLRLTLGPTHPVTQKCVANLAVLLTELNNEAVHRAETGDLTHAEPLFRHVRERRRRLLGRHHQDTLESLRNHASCLRLQGRVAEAERLLRCHIWIALARLKRHSDPTLSTALGLALRKYWMLPEAVGRNRPQILAGLKEAGMPCDVSTTPALG